MSSNYLLPADSVYIFVMLINKFYIKYQSDAQQSASITIKNQETKDKIYVIIETHKIWRYI